MLTISLKIRAAFARPLEREKRMPAGIRLIWNRIVRIATLRGVWFLTKRIEGRP